MNNFFVLLIFMTIIINVFIQTCCVWIQTNIKESKHRPVVTHLRIFSLISQLGHLTIGRRIQNSITPWRNSLFGSWIILITLFVKLISRREINFSFLKLVKYTSILLHSIQQLVSCKEVNSISFVKSGRSFFCFFKVSLNSKI